ncbi:MAG TPA: shikimate kinase [Candidatus Dormibacteraeota bacterium]|nr:shikimate kinase [Candidatus Dormibacteraeota bacterium]
MQTIYLIGFMGSGKSTIGVRLADKLGKSYVDTDEFIVNTSQQKIADIFKNFGEDTFRNYETKAIKEVSNYEVVSTGGGIVEKSDNLQIMKNNGLIVYLHASFDEISNRLEKDQTRPLWKSNDEEKLKLYRRRLSMYKQYADHIVHTDGKTVDDIIQEIENYIS